MRADRPNPNALRAEARLLTTAGVLLLVTSFPVTLFLVAQALLADGSPFLPVAVGAPPMMLGYLACHFASQRMVKAKALESTQQAPAASSQGRALPATLKY